MMEVTTLSELIAFQDAEIKLLENIRNCIKLKIKCDREYAASVLTVSICAQQHTIRNGFKKTSINKAWELIGHEMEYLSNVVKNNADEFASELFGTLDDLVCEKKEAKKTLVQEINKLSKEFEQVI